MNQKRVVYAAICAALLGTARARAQWMTQQIELRAGWNPVFLYVEPEPNDCDTLFAEAPFSAMQVRRYRRSFAPFQFIQDPGDVDIQPAGWLTWYPAGAAHGFARDLYTLNCGNAYFIQLAPGAEPVTWELRGRPLMKEHDWASGAYNLVGFQIGDVPPTFAQFFAGTPELSTQPLYRLSEAGNWERVSNPASTVMRDGEAFWVHAGAASRYQGPLGVTAYQRTGVNFGRGLVESELAVANASGGAATVLVRRVASELPPAPSDTALAGPVPLSFRGIETNGLPMWIEFGTQTINRVLADGEDWDLVLAVRRAAMTPFTAPPGRDARYQDLLEVTDSSGRYRRFVPVTAAGPGYDTAPAASSQILLDPSPNPPPGGAGLWVGSAVIDKVSQPTAPDPQALLPTASEFSFRVLLHVDTNETVRLLRSVLIMWQDGTTTNDPANPGLDLVAEPGRHVLVTDPSLVDSFSGATLRDGESIGRRISTAAFGFPEPVTMAWSGGTNYGCTIAVDYDDPLNPFLHRYHPDHNNLDDRGTPLPTAAGPDGAEHTRESYTVTRRITVEFTAADPEDQAHPGWGDTQIGGIWREAITGLRYQTNWIGGYFRLNRASRAGVLNDGQ